MNKVEAPEWVKEIAINDAEISTVEEFKEKYMYRPKHDREWHEAVLKTMKQQVEKVGYTLISNHSSITKESIFFIPK